MIVLLLAGNLSPKAGWHSSRKSKRKASKDQRCCPARPAECSARCRMTNAEKHKEVMAADVFSLLGKRWVRINIFEVFVNILLSRGL